MVLNVIGALVVGAIIAMGVVKALEIARNRSGNKGEEK